MLLTNKIDILKKLLNIIKCIKMQNTRICTIHSRHITCVQYIYIKNPIFHEENVVPRFSFLK